MLKIKPKDGPDSADPIKVHEDEQLEKWSAYLGVTKEELRAAMWRTEMEAKENRTM